MIAQAQALLAGSVGGVMSASGAATAFAVAHPLGLGVVAGVGAYFAASKYLLNKGEPAAA